MKNVLKTIGSLSLVLLLAACSDGSTPTEAEKNMAEMMGITVEELRNQTPEEHMQMMKKMNDNSDANHHQGETDVKPHDDSMNQVMDDHHAGEENVEPHEHEEDDKPKPPSRSIKANDDHHEGEENVEPHGH